MGKFIEEFYYGNIDPHFKKSIFNTQYISNSYYIQISK